jgi:hypothetical protein
MFFDNLGNTHHLFAFIAMVKKAKVADFHIAKVVSGLKISNTIPECGLVFFKL